MPAILAPFGFAMAAAVVRHAAIHSNPTEASLNFQAAWFREAEASVMCRQQSKVRYKLGRASH